MLIRLSSQGSMRVLITLFIGALYTCAQINVKQVDKPTETITPVVLISIDGFRYDYFEKYQPPHLLELIRTGVRATRMLPVYPSKTFPNHISIVTGMYPSNHGIVHNKFYDRDLDDIYTMGKAFDEPKWMQGTPLWIHAERNGMKTASYFWAESDSTLQGISATYSYKYDKQRPYQDRVDQIINWLKLPATQRPIFISGYFSLVDTIGHAYGPNSDQVKAAVLNVDGYLGNLIDRMNAELGFKVNLLVVSDHGMLEFDFEQKIDWRKIANFDDFMVVNGTTQLLLYSKNEVNQANLNSFVDKLNTQSNDRFKAYVKNDLPKRLHYSGNDRIADIIVEAIPPIIFSNTDSMKNPYVGMHGYDPDTNPEMGTIFIANGPNFKQGVTIPAFRNIHVFPVLVDILGLPMPEDIDGKLEVLKPILKSQ